jgi:hypothetical protein
MKKQKQKLEKLPIKKINIAFFVLTFISLVLYLMNLNAMNAAGYKIKETEKKIADLKEENKSLGLALAEKQSMEKVMAAVQTLGMVEVGKVHYVTGAETAMAKR